MDDADAGPQSLCVVVSRDSIAPYYSSIIQLEIPQVHSHGCASSSSAIETEFSAHIPRLPLVKLPIAWAISLPPDSSTGDLYMLPDCPLPRKSEIEKVGRLPGFIFNLSTKKCKIIKASLAPKDMGHVVTMGDHIYFMAQPRWGENSPDPRFERYDTLSQSWEPREPFPLFTGRDPPYIGFIDGTAVLDDTILFNIYGLKMWAYNLVRDKWYPVTVSNDLCYNIVGAAVVLNKIIYAITEFCESIVAMTLKSDDIEGDLVFTCDLHKEYLVPGMDQVQFDLWDSYRWTKKLVHLGKDNFCVVQSCNHYGVKNQYIQVTYIEVRDEKFIVTDICLHELKLPSGDQFVIRHCFSMPNCKTTALKEGNRFLKLNPEHEAEIVTLPPELLQFQDKYVLHTNIIDEQGGSVDQTSQSGDDVDTTPEVPEDVPKKSSASAVDVPSIESILTGHQSLNYARKASILGDGHSIFVKNLPPHPNFNKFYKGLERFGQIKSFAFLTDPDNTNESFAVVEFESATSKQNAIKASTIKIGGRLAVIEEKRGTGLTQGGSVCQTSQSRDDADTTPQVQEDVPKKSSASVVTGKSNVPSIESILTGHQSLNYATKASTLGDGHSICVTNLPPDTSFCKLFKGLERFGPIKSFAFHIDPDNASDSFADVEFKSATSKQSAIKASTIKTGGRHAVIEEKRGTGLTHGGSVSQTSESRDDADTTPQVQEDVPKKSSASVVAGKSNVPSKASTVPGHQSLNHATKASTLGHGHSIFVTNLPPGTNYRQLVQGLKRFGPIKGVGIHTCFDNMVSECCSADVEFENATSKQNAIKESIITIGGRIAVIEEKRGTGLTQGDSNRSSSKTSRIKLKKHSKGRSKTSRKGLSKITPLLESY